MGTLADRLARRTHPLFPEAKQLVNQARAVARGKVSELDDTVEEILANFEPDEVDEILDLAFEETSLLAEGDRVEDCLMEAAHRVAESDSIEDIDRVVFGLPIAVRGFFGSDHYELSPEQQEAIVEWLKAFELISSDADIEVVPELFSPRGADELGLGEIYRLSRALFDGDGEDVEPPYEEHLVARPSSGDSSRTYLMLVGAVVSSDGIPFVLARLREVEQRSLPRDPSQPEFASSRAELDDDLQDHLLAASSAARKILGVDEALVFPPDKWQAVSDRPFVLEREEIARNKLRAMAEEYCGGVLSALVIYSPEMEGHDIAYPIHRISDRSQVGVVVWPMAAAENVTDASMAMITFASEQLDVFPGYDDREEPPLGPLH